MSVTVKAFETLNVEDWDDFVDQSNTGTIFHKLQFLKYHPPKRFPFHNLVFYYKAKIVALLPGMLDDKGVFKSPAGASYGGFVMNNAPFAKQEAVLDTFISYAKEKRFTEAVITPTPFIYHKSPNEIERFLLEYKGFKRKYHLLTNSVSLKDLNTEYIINSLSSMHKRAVNKSLKLGVQTKFSTKFEEFYPILLANKTKFDAAPTHTLEELIKLKKLLPDNIKLLMAYDDKKNPIGGIFLFICNENTVLTFYISHYYEFQHLRAVNRLLYEVMIWAKENGYNNVDFGVSMDTSSDNPMEPSRSLIHFKEGTGSRGFLRTTYHYEF